MSADLLYWLDQIQPSHRTIVGDKAFYLGLLLQRGYPVVPGCVVSALAFQEFLERVNWLEPMFSDLPNSSLYVDVNNSRQLQAVAQQIRQAIQATPLSDAWLAQINTQVNTSVQQWQAQALILRPSFSLSSASDPTVSIRTTGLLEAQVCWAKPGAIAQSLKQVWAGLFRARSLLYWQRLGIPLQQIRLAVLVQPVWPTIASGESQIYESELEIRAVWGLSKALANGEVKPDRDRVHLRTGLHLYHPGHKTHAYRIVPIAETSPVLEPFQSVTLSEQAPSQKKPPEQNPYEFYPLEFAQQVQKVLNSEQIQQITHLTQQAVVDLSTLLKMEWALCQHPGLPQPALYLTQIIPQLAAASPTNWPKQNREHTLTGSQRSQEMRESRAAAQQQTLTSPDSRDQSLLLKGLAAAPGRVRAIAWVVDPTTSLLTDIPTDVILVAPIITPDWLLRIKQVAAILTEQGGITSHGAILAREMGIPAVVGVDQATRLIQSGDRLFVDGDRGEVSWLTSDARLAESSEPKPSKPAIESLEPIESLELEREPGSTLRSESPASSPLTAKLTHSTAPLSFSVPAQTPARLNATQLLVTLSQPNSIAQVADLPVDGVGLLRSELMILSVLERRHPNWWLRQGRQSELIDRIASQVQQFVHAFAPRPVFYRSLDLRSHEFPSLGEAHPIPEINPMLGVRGTFSYQVNPSLFDVELAALKQVQQWGYTNLHLLLPFVRTVEEFSFCQQRVEQAGLTQTDHFQLWIMAEVPSVLLLLPDYFKAGVQGITIGSNDLTQLLLGVDRDQHQMAAAFEPHHPAVLRAIQHIIQTTRQAGIPCSICGQALRQSSTLVESLVRWGITAISVNPNEVERAYGAIAYAEQRLLLERTRHHSRD